MCALLAAGTACGDDDDDDDGDGDGGGTPDAAVVDDVDAAPPATHSALVLLLEGRFEAFPELGEGVLTESTFQVKTDVVPPSFEESPGSPFACKVFEFTPATFAPAGVDEGPVQFTVDGGPPVPPCIYVPGQGYRCIGAMGTGGDIEVANPKMGIFSITDSAITLGPDQVGRFLIVQGATNPSNNGQFPIVMAAGDNTILYQNPQPGAAEELDTTATYLTAAGFGPAGQTTPIPDDASVTIALSPGGDGDVAEFSQTLDIGDSFTLDTASQETISNLPSDGSAFTLSCDGEGGDCGTSGASLLNLIATDGDVSQLPPFVLPPPQSKAVQIFCVFLAGRTAVPAEASAFLAGQGFTRARAVFVRANNLLFAQPKAEIQVAAGHAVAGFTDFASAK
ncbi:MAG TPA: hypothetical protein VK698_16135 [Kofleriaceae bacterium]|nr:hypothetical protein [Kofleriaceae bacterium]